MPDRVTLPPFELATYVANDVVEDSPTRWDAGRLHLDGAALVSSAADPALAEIHLHVVRPGDAVRVANVLDAVLPDVKATDPERTFPGALGALALSGHGRTNRVAGLGVLSVCDWLAAGYTTEEEFPDSLVDMDGPGAPLTRWGSTTNVVVRCVPAEGAPVGDVDRAVRRASLRVARDIAATTIDREPDAVETFSAPAPDVDPALPAVCGILQVASEGPLTDTFLYGRQVGGIDPTVLDPLELLDGALTNGAYDWPAVRNVTATYQDSSLVRTLLAGHGERLRFAGLILALGYLDSSFEKQRSAMLSARLARWLGADGGDLHDVLVRQLPHRHHADRQGVRVARDPHHGDHQRDERRAHRSRGGGRQHRQRRQRGRARRPVVARPRDRGGRRASDPASRSRRGRTSARACETGDMSLTAVPA